MYHDYALEAANVWLWYIRSVGFRFCVGFEYANLGQNALTILGAIVNTIGRDYVITHEKKKNVFNSISSYIYVRILEVVII